MLQMIAEAEPLIIKRSLLPTQRQLALSTEAREPVTPEIDTFCKQRLNTLQNNSHTEDSWDVKKYAFGSARYFPLNEEVSHLEVAHFGDKLVRVEITVERSTCSNPNGSRVMRHNDRGVSKHVRM
jgi:hypothetical protein